MSFDVRNFEQDVLARSSHVPVLVDFWAEWCGPCRMLGPVLEKLESESGGAWQLAKLDTEALPDVASRYGIRSIPNVKLFIDGAPVAEFTGALPEQSVRQFLAEHLPAAGSNEVDEAEALLLEGRSSEAAVLLEHILESDAANDRARVLYAQMFLDDDPTKAASLVAPVEAGSKYDDIADAIRTFARYRLFDTASLPEHPVRDLYISAITALNDADFDSALEHFIDVIRRNRYYDDDGARKACIAIFKILGEEHEITLRHRRDFNGSLY